MILSYLTRDCFGCEKGPRRDFGKAGERVVSKAGLKIGGLPRIKGAREALST
jgi:hypothetical protein